MQERDRDRMREVLTLMNDRPTLRRQIPAMLNASMIVLKRFDDDVLSCSVPFLVALLSDAKLRDDSIAVFRWLVEMGVDVSMALPAIEAQIDGSSENARRQASYCSAVYHMDHRGDFTVIDRLLSDTRTSVRTGAIDALRLLLTRRKAYIRECGSRTVKMLVDSDEAIRKAAYSLLEGAFRNGMDIDPGIDAINHVLWHRDKGDEYLFRYLVSRAEKSRETVQAILGVTEEASSSHAATMERLMRYCREIIAGTHIPSCSLCKFIPREFSCSLECDVPKEVMKLLPEMPISSPGLRQCPRCGNYYKTSYSFEYESPTDGMSVSLDIGIRRLSPPEALHFIEGGDLDNLRKSYDGLIEKAARLLEHPERYLREDAVCTLTLHYLGRKNWIEITSLIRNDDDVVKLTSLKILSQCEMPELDGAAVSIEALLNNTGIEVRKHAAMLLARYYFHIRNTEKLKKMAEMDDPVVTTAAIQMILSDKAIDLKPFLSIIRNSLASADENLRYQAKNAIVASIEKRIEVSSTIESLIALLSDEKKTDQSERALCPEACS